MDNLQIIKIVEEIVNPYFIFNLDYYKDITNNPEPIIEELPVLFFRANCHHDKYKISIISKNKQRELVEKIEKLNVGNVSLELIPYFGRYIIVTPNR
jgi:hypothetical protein